MATISTADPQFESAVRACATALRRFAEFELTSDLQQRIESLSARKEFLSREEHGELLGLADFWRKRLLEKLEARAALERLRGLAPELVEDQ